MGWPLNELPHNHDRSDRPLESSTKDTQAGSKKRPSSHLDNDGNDNGQKNKRQFVNKQISNPQSRPSHRRTASQPYDTSNPQQRHDTQDSYPRPDFLTPHNPSTHPQQPAKSYSTYHLQQASVDYSHGPSFPVPPPHNYPARPEQSSPTNHIQPHHTTQPTHHPPTTSPFRHSTDTDSALKSALETSDILRKSLANAETEYMNVVTELNKEKESNYILRQRLDSQKDNGRDESLGDQLAGASENYRKSREKYQKTKESLRIAREHNKSLNFQLLESRDQHSFLNTSYNNLKREHDAMERLNKLHKAPTFQELKFMQARDEAVQKGIRRLNRQLTTLQNESYRLQFEKDEAEEANETLKQKISDQESRIKKQKLYAEEMSSKIKQLESSSRKDEERRDILMDKWKQLYESRVKAKAKLRDKDELIKSLKLRLDTLERENQVDVKPNITHQTQANVVKLERS
ncbi:uncharacterized protein L201_000135 [Kwoniella dendrophila CBS 6074]|uniref:Lebercilin domain-containing protein n=1 Tax=Kwoniella dendrophila CBS 6074 TaxID=1295534 RepID=A0AAX4JLI3_9TREE